MSQNLEDPTQGIIDFLREKVHKDVNLDTELIESGLLDSFKAVELLSFVEERFNVRIEPTDLSPAVMSTPQGIIGLVTSLLKRREPAPA